MHTENVFIVHPANTEQASALKAFIKALKIKFEVTEKAYNPDFVAKIEESREQYKDGDFTVIKTDDLWK
jgi:hypothetical protein